MMHDGPTLVADEKQAADFIGGLLSESVLSVEREALSKSGNGVFRAQLGSGESIVLRVSSHRTTFSFTQHHFQVLRKLGMSVPSVLASGFTETGGSYIILSWLAGRDLLYELPDMTRPQVTRFAAQWVDFSRRLASLPASGGYGWGAIGRDGPFARWTDVFGEPIPNGIPVREENTPLGRYRAGLRALRAQLEPYFAAIRPVCFLDDHCLKNILIWRGRLNGIIDVDFVFYGDPLLAVGATLAENVRYLGDGGRFYGEELVRLWSPDRQQQTAIRFYAGLYTTGFLSLIDPEQEPDEVQRLTEAAENWLIRETPAAA